MIRLVTISRISKEKGFERMLQLEQLMIQAKMSFIWNCYGDTSTDYARKMIPKFKSVNFRGVTHKPLEVVEGYDYLVQLSNTEGFCYSIYEALSRKVPVIATRYDSVNEMITDGVNGYILEMDLSNFDKDKILNIPVIKSFREKSNEKDWIKFLDMAKKRTTPAASRRPKATEDKHNMVTRRKYFDTEDSVLREIGDKFTATPERQKVLIREGVAKVITEITNEDQKHLSTLGL